MNPFCHGSKLHNLSSIIYLINRLKKTLLGNSGFCVVVFFLMDFSHDGKSEVLTRPDGDIMLSELT